MKLSTTAALRSAAAAGVDMRLLEQLFDHTPDLAFFIKDAAGCYLAVNHSLLERHGLRDKAQMLGRRPCDVCPGDFGRIPAASRLLRETDRHVADIALECGFYDHSAFTGAFRAVVGVTRCNSAPGIFHMS